MFFSSNIFFILHRSVIPGILELIPCLSKSISPGGRNRTIFLVNLSYTYFVTYPWHRLVIHISGMRPPQTKTKHIWFIFRVDLPGVGPVRILLNPLRLSITCILNNATTWIRTRGSPLGMQNPKPLSHSGK